MKFLTNGLAALCVLFACLGVAELAFSPAPGYGILAWGLGMLAMGTAFGAYVVETEEEPEKKSAKKQPVIHDLDETLLKGAIMVAENEGREIHLTVPLKMLKEGFDHVYISDPIMCGESVFVLRRKVADTPNKGSVHIKTKYLPIDLVPDWAKRNPDFQAMVTQRLEGDHKCLINNIVRLKDLKVVEEKKNASAGGP